MLIISILKNKKNVYFTKITTNNVGKDIKKSEKKIIFLSLLKYCLNYSLWIEQNELIFLSYFLYFQG